MTGRVLVFALLAGWLADRLARPDRDVEAGIEAYETGELDAALERFEAAIARHGDRPELSLNRGLVLLAQGDADAARRAFERASESDDPEVRSSAFYERGNVAFDAEDWDAAIEAYIECLKARPDHANAKWNLELARKRKQEQDKEDEKDDEEKDDETGGEDSGGSTGDDSGGSTGDDSGGSTGDDSGGSSGDDGSGGTSGGSSGDEGSGGSGGSGQPPPDDGGKEQEQEQEPKDDQPPPEDQQQPPRPPPAPLDQMDLEKALEDLDEQDQFLLDRPSGGVRPPTEDW